MVPLPTLGPSTGDRLASRSLHYGAFTLLFGVVYGWLALSGRFPRWLLFGVLFVSLSKDVYDEYRLRRGRPPLAYAGVEHAPSNAVLLVLLLSGVLVPQGTVAGVPAPQSATLLAAADLVIDLSQDVRAGVRGSVR